MTGLKSKVCVKNFVNGNAGNDQFFLQFEAGGGTYLGGKGNDIIRYESLPKETMNAINGNKGNDSIIGGSGAFALARGGQGDDYIVGAGVLYGDKGADTFGIPRDGQGRVKDFNPNEDQVYYNDPIGKGELQVIPSSTDTPGIVITQPNVEGSLFLENVFSIDVVQLIAELVLPV